MLKGEELGKALVDAMDRMQVTQNEVGSAFGVKQSSVSEWRKLGRIGKQHIPMLLSYFSEVVGPDHWGLPFTRDEFELILGYRSLHPTLQEQVLASVRLAAAKEEGARREASAVLKLLPTVKKARPPATKTEMLDRMIQKIEGPDKDL